MFETSGNHALSFILFAAMHEHKQRWHASRAAATPSRHAFSGTTAVEAMKIIAGERS